MILCKHLENQSSDQKHDGNISENWVLQARWSPVRCVLQNFVEQKQESTEAFIFIKTNQSIKFSKNKLKNKISHTKLILLFKVEKALLTITVLIMKTGTSHNISEKLMINI